MQKLNRTTAGIEKPFAPKILQFGGGNFLRGFADWIIDTYNIETGKNWGILVVKPTARGDYETWRQQEGLFHILTKGIKNGTLMEESHLVKSVSQIIHPYKEWTAFLASAENKDLKYILSNTTEMGILFSEKDALTDSPPQEFPAKLTLWLYHRFKHFYGAENAGCVLLPTELLEANGVALKKTILQYVEHWELGDTFKDWIHYGNVFCNTLVDRIIPGVGKDSLSKAWEQAGFEDAMITQGEPYHFWAIEAPQAVRTAFPLDKIGLNVVYTDDLRPYRTIKVRILNGAHTSMVPAGYLYGIETVREAVEHPIMGQFIQKILFEEIIPTLDLPKAELQQFAKDVLDRFKNPFIKHRLISISLNGVAKFKTRVLPSILDYKKRKGELPDCLIFAMAALVHFYKGIRNGQAIPLKDDPTAIAFLQKEWSNCDGSVATFQQMAQHILEWEYAWETDLSTIDGFKTKLAGYLSQIEAEGMQAALSALV